MCIWVYIWYVLISSTNSTLKYKLYFYYRIHIMIMIERTTQNKIAKNDKWDYDMRVVEEVTVVWAYQRKPPSKIRTRYRQRSTRNVLIACETMHVTLIKTVSFPTIQPYLISLALIMRRKCWPSFPLLSPLPYDRKHMWYTAADNNHFLCVILEITRK